MPEIPGSVWRRPEMLDALRARDIAQVFRLVRQYAGMSQTAIGSAIGMSQGKVSAIMNGNQQVAALEVFERIADGLEFSDQARLALGLAPRTSASIPVEDGSHANVSGTVGRRLSEETRRRKEDGSTVQRRTFVTMTAAAMVGAVLSDNTAADDPVDDLAAALTEHSAPVVAIPALASLTASVAKVKRGYQACRYGDVLAVLPGLLVSLRAAGTALDGDDQRRAHALSAEAYHVAASVMLKREDRGLAWLAADRSMQTARMSEEPTMVGSSARIITHVLMDGGHHRAAAGKASAIAQHMDASIKVPSADVLSVYGALLLRGAIAAAQHGDRHSVTELLDEAERAGRRLGHEGNHMWTAFGPDNVLCHRVHAAVSMGDAGIAITYARQVKIDALPINERRAALLLDTARAFLMWGKHERALKVLRTAGQIAPEEITSRPAARRLVGELVTTAPITVRREAREFADALGATA